MHPNPEMKCGGKFSLGPLERRGYSFGKTLGKGSYGCVLRARYRDSQNGETVELACKYINKLKAPQDFLERFFPRELEILQRTNHPNIIRTHSILQCGSGVFIFMRLVNVSGSLAWRVIFHFSAVRNMEIFLTTSRNAEKSVSSKLICGSSKWSVQFAISTRLITRIVTWSAKIFWSPSISTSKSPISALLDRRATRWIKKFCHLLIVDPLLMRHRRSLVVFLISPRKLTFGAWELSCVWWFMVKCLSMTLKFRNFVKINSLDAWRLTKWYTWFWARSARMWFKNAWSQKFAIDQPSIKSITQNGSKSERRKWKIPDVKHNHSSTLSLNF